MLPPKRQRCRGRLMLRVVVGRHRHGVLLLHDLLVAPEREHVPAAAADVPPRARPLRVRRQHPQRAPRVVEPLRQQQLRRLVAQERVHGSSLSFPRGVSFAFTIYAKPARLTPLSSPLSHHRGPSCMPRLANPCV